MVLIDFYFLAVFGLTLQGGTCTKRFFSSMTYTGRRNDSTLKK